MVRVAVDLDSEWVDSVVKKDLESLRDNMLSEVKKKHTSMVFHTDNKKDKKSIKKFIKSLNKVIEFYGGTQVYL